jgi:5-formyltetrahydrofolate cyclo-ligase
MINIFSNKSEIRRSLLAQRQAYEPSGKSSGTEVSNITELFVKNISLSPSDVIAGYWPVRGELDILPLMRQLSKTNIVCLPKVFSESDQLSFHKFNDNELIMGKFGISEPKSNTDPQHPNILLVPCIAVTINGDRLGYGCGYYDSTLRNIRKSHPIIAIGVVYEFQVLVELPTTDNDEKLDVIITPNYIASCDNK